MKQGFLPTLTPTPYTAPLDAVQFAAHGDRVRAARPRRRRTHRRVWAAGTSYLNLFVIYYFNYDTLIPLHLPAGFAADVFSQHGPVHSGSADPAVRQEWRWHVGSR
eukprot:SAG31_NODE_2510_length_5586_cov_2.799344_5_plen_106_part_00